MSLVSREAIIEAGRAAGLRTCSEVFADRSYQSDGSLTPRGQPGALIDNTEKAVAQALEMVRNQRVKSIDGQWVPLQADTICIHGDGPHAVEFVRALYGAFEREGIRVLSFEF